MPLGLAALALLMLAGLGAAQAPSVPLPGAASVDVRASTDILRVGLDAPAAATVTVANTERSTGNAQLDQPRLIALSVAGVPKGWTASLSPASLRLRPGESQQATLQLSVSADAQGREAKLTVTARAYARGVDAVPVAGPLADPEAVAAASVDAVRSDTPERVLLETVGPYVWLLLLALVAAAVVILSLLGANRRVAVRLSVAEPQRTVAPGARAVFPVLVRNLTRRADTVTLRVAGASPGWGAFLPTPQLDLEGSRQEEVPVVVIAPRDAAEGTRQPFTVQATSTQARRPAAVTVEAEVVAPRRARGREAVPPGA
ncbi:MAG TPA: NEW3 domain-containing protein [Candidatus Thermoplasmatota archaeon]|nr:NEW3 domain-containing protein [Candidatus Thermoplasmatota archaeon]